MLAYGLQRVSGLCVYVQVVMLAGKGGADDRWNTSRLRHAHLPAPLTCPGSKLKTRMLACGGDADGGWFGSVLHLLFAWSIFGKGFEGFLFNILEEEGY